MITKINIVRISLPVLLFAFAASLTNVQPVLASATGPATMHLSEGQTGPGGGFEIVDTIETIRMSPDGSWTTRVQLVDLISGVREAYFGSINGANPSYLRFSKTTVNSILQEDFISSAYPAPVSGELLYLTHDQFGARTVWVDDDIYAQGGDALPPASPLAGNYVLDGPSSLSPRGWTDDGEVILYGRWSTTQGGSQTGHGIVIGPDAIPVVQGGDAIGGIPQTVPATSNEGSIGNFAISGDQAHWISVIDIDPTSGITEQIVVNGTAVTMVGGALLQEGVAIDAAAGGLPDEIWDNGGASAFGETTINGDGEWWAVGSALEPIPDTDQWVLIHGNGTSDATIFVREGAIIEGLTLEGNSPRLELNEDGDLTFWAEAENAGPNGVEAIYVNAEPIIKTGDLVDTTGDGIADTALERVFLADLAVSDRDVNGNILVAFTAQTVGGAESLFTLEVDPREFGDFNDDDLVNADDIDLISLVAIQGGSDPGVYDLDFDGDIDADDRNQHILEEVGTVLGDANLDYSVNGSDLSILASNFGSNGGWGQGDYNGDGIINGADLSILASNFGQAATSATPIPEPASLVMLGLVSLACLKRRP